ncbi:MAG: DNA polymerase III subunit delta' [Rhodothermales bacterium]
MGWTSVLGQDRVKDTLQQTVARDRVAHAYLFHGPDGTGKRAAGLAFAQTLLCLNSSDAPCGHCQPCSKVQRLIHPDLHILFPAPKDANTDDLTARVQRLAEHPYAAVDYVRRPSLNDPSKTSNKQAFYSVARVNEALRRTMSFKPVEGRYKIALLTDAHLLRTEAANAFLKLLEEPGPRTVFVLTTNRLDRVLPTILSRCQRLRFDPLPADAIEHALTTRDGIATDRAGMLARMADGSYSRALELAENETLLADRELVLTFFRHAYTRNIDQLADRIEEMGRTGRERVKGMLRLMLSWLRDLMLYHTLQTQAPLVNIDQREAIRNFCEKVPNADVEAMVTLVEEGMDLVERNVHVNLLLTVLAHALGRAMRGQAVPGLFVPLPEQVLQAVS